MGVTYYKRADTGIFTTVGMSIGITGVIVAALMIFAAPAVSLFTNDPSVVEYGVLFMRTNNIFLLFNCVNHVLAGGLRGKGDSRGPMVIMLLSFVAARQIYLFVITRFVANTPILVGIGYPVGWSVCCITAMNASWRNSAPG